ncbi:hypothetical protein GGX14DRAFT_572774 [Mycena pura]|uniref:Uncharacterized protein n=1 Tax=Mycena pura TaxID=153505 RepID=A0AAD6V0Z5_9AGAR|nr:hypothetical protein GGX14DRAFT_572774 [Mycena pura]
MINIPQAGPQPSSSPSSTPSPVLAPVLVRLNGGQPVLMDIHDAQPAPTDMSIPVLTASLATQNEQQLGPHAGTLFCHLIACLRLADDSHIALVLPNGQAVLLFRGCQLTAAEQQILSAAVEVSVETVQDFDGKVILGVARGLSSGVDPFGLTLTTLWSTMTGFTHHIILPRLFDMVSREIKFLSIGPGVSLDWGLLRFLVDSSAGRGIQRLEVTINSLRLPASTPSPLPSQIRELETDWDCAAALITATPGATVFDLMEPALPFTTASLSQRRTMIALVMRFSQTTGRLSLILSPIIGSTPWVPPCEGIVFEHVGIAELRLDIH